MSPNRYPPASRARPHGAVGLSGCVFCLTLTLIVLQTTGSAPFVKAWMLGWLPW